MGRASGKEQVLAGIRGGIAAIKRKNPSGESWDRDGDVIVWIEKTQDHKNNSGKAKEINVYTECLRGSFHNESQDTYVRTILPVLTGRRER
jgi:hypothetical protein